jgi:hypothetical protein
VIGIDTEQLESKIKTSLANTTLHCSSGVETSSEPIISSNMARPILSAKYLWGGRSYRTYYSLAVYD